MKEYPLLTAWLEGHLYEAWMDECGKMKLEDPKLLDWVVRYEAAAHVSGHLSEEEANVVWQASRDHADPAVVQFRNALKSLRGYRDILKDISGNPHIWSDELRYMASLYTERAKA